MPLLDLPGPFVDNANVPVSPTDVNALIRAALTVDGLSYRRVPAFDSAASLDTGSPDRYDAGTFRVWWGGLVMQTGMTTLTITGTMTKSGAASLQFLLNSVVFATQTTDGTFTKTISLSGYADGTLLEIEVQVLNQPNASGTYLISDCYADTPAPTTAYPGKAIFGPTYQAANFAQLVRCVQHCADRIGQVPRPAQLSHRYGLGGTGSSTRPTWTAQERIYTGYVTKYYSNDILRVYGTAYIGPGDERLRIDLNGTTIYIGPTWGPGTYGISVPYALAGAIGTRARVDLAYEAVGPGVATWDRSRYTIDYVGSEPDASGYAAATPPGDLAALASYSQSDLTARLNAIATIVDDTKQRLDANSALWGRVRATRRRYAKRDGQDANIARYAPRLTRQFDRLVVVGKAVKLGWGPLILASPLTKDYSWEPAYSQTVNDGDSISTKVVYLDSCKGLTVGQPYYLLGDVRYAAEDNKS